MRTSVSRIAILALATTLLYCGGTSNPTNPSPPSPSSVSAAPTPPGTGIYTISGRVTEGGRPIAAVTVNAWWVRGAYPLQSGTVLTDDDGHYRLTHLTSTGSAVWVYAWKDGYAQQCAVPPFYLGDATEVTADITLVARANVTASPQPAAGGFRSVVGTVVEMAPAGIRAVADIEVNSEVEEDTPAAGTYTDGDGRFALCGLPANASVGVYAILNGRVVGNGIVPPGQTDITITLR
jgi:hypothetical protein